MPSPVGYVPVDHGYSDCPICGKEFKKKQLSHKRCSAECTKEHYKRLYVSRQDYCVYMLYTDEDERVYIGKTNDFELRFKAHCQDSESSTSKYLIGEKKGRVLAHLETERDMLLLERILIAFADPSTTVNTA